MPVHCVLGLFAVSGYADLKLAARWVRSGGKCNGTPVDAAAEFIPNQIEAAVKTLRIAEAIAEFRQI